MCSLGAFQIAAFVLVSRVTKSACEPFKRSISVSYSPLGLHVSPLGPGCEPCWCSKPDVLGVHLSVTIPKDWGT